MGTPCVRILHSLDELIRVAPAWTTLAGGVPFCEPPWLLTWWKHYGGGARRPWAVAVEEDGRLIGLAPWYVECSPWSGRVVRFFGSGRVCSDYLTLLTEPRRETDVARFVARSLCTQARGAWDRIEFDGATINDPALQALFHEFARCGAEIDRRPGPHCWRLALPDDWEAYLAMLSKSHRKQLRRLATNVLDTPRARWHTTVDESTFAHDWAVLVDLHGRRRRSIGDVGCFDDPQFHAFHREAALQFLRQGRLRLHRLELDGRPVAVEYHFVGGRTIYAYQSGIDPAVIDEEPGRLAAIAVLRGALAEGLSTYDLMRGDEPYKAHWRAEPTAAEQVTVVAPRPLSRLRYAVRCRMRRLKQSFSPAAAPSTKTGCEA